MTGENWILEDSRYMRLHKLRRDAFQILSHSHPYWQLIVVTAGELTVSTAAKQFDVAARLKAMACSESYRDRIVEIQEKGQEFHVE